MQPQKVKFKYVQINMKQVLYFQNAYNLFFPEKILGFNSKLRKGRVTLNTGIFLVGLANGTESYLAL